MGRESRKTTLPAVGKSAKTRHARMALADPAVYSTLNALKQAPTLKHKSYFEIAENTDKKSKKLETQVTDDRTPPPGYEFIALGNPDLAELCKDMSREQDAMIFIVSESKDDSVFSQTHRLGWHFRERIVEQAREVLRKRGLDQPQKFATTGRPEAIPQDRVQMIKEADAVLRDLFPRIPNFSRTQILEHSFDKNNKYFNGKEKVGMAEDLPLARRVQLAALSHIRHTMTRYDDLLREGQKWENARKAVEKPCLDIIAKWRGDEETGRDQLDEILREVIEISDDEDSSEEDTSEEEILPGPSNHRMTRIVSANTPRSRAGTQIPIPRTAVAPSPDFAREPLVLPITSPTQPRRLTRKERKAAKQTQQRFKRYAQVAETFRDDLQRSRSPIADHSQENYQPRSRSIPGYLDSYHEPGRHVSTPIAPTMYVESQHRTVTHTGLERLRGQSPVFVRVAEANGLKAGPHSDRQGYGPTPVSPVRNQFQDMLVRSIEPLSPGVARTHESSGSYFMPLESERINRPLQTPSRLVLEQVPNRPQYLTTEEPPSQHRQLISQPSAHSDLFSRVGFIQVNREPQRKTFAQGHQSDPSRRSYYLQTSQELARPHSPPVYIQDPIRTGTNHVVYTPNPEPVYIHEPLPHNRDVPASRSRNSPIILEAPHPRRLMDPRQYRDRSDYDQRSLAQHEMVRSMPTRDNQRIPERLRAVYVDEPGPQIIRARESHTGYHIAEPVIPEPRNFRPQMQTGAIPLPQNGIAFRGTHSSQGVTQRPIIAQEESRVYMPHSRPASRVAVLAHHPTEVRYEQPGLWDHGRSREAPHDQAVPRPIFPNQPQPPVPYH